MSQHIKATGSVCGKKKSPEAESYLKGKKRCYYLLLLIRSFIFCSKMIKFLVILFIIKLNPRTDILYFRDIHDDMICPCFNHVDIDQNFLFTNIWYAESGFCLNIVKYNWVSYESLCYYLWKVGMYSKILTKGSKLYIITTYSISYIFLLYFSEYEAIKHFSMLELTILRNSLYICHFI